jgi:predicted nuclease of restriction endonuclease-like RecB superfamily
MLTKDLLRYRNRKDRVYPTLVDPKDAALLGLADGLIAIFNRHVGRRLSDLDDELNCSEWGQHPHAQGLRKLLLDRCNEVEDDGVISTKREQLLAHAEKLRKEVSFASLTEFQQAFAKSQGSELAQLQEQLYADLPDFRVLKDFEALAPATLLHRYNCAQIQGLLMMAEDVELLIKSPSLDERRGFFRSLKFQRLMSEVSVAEDSGDISCKLSGPLRIFQNSQSYGLRLAQFFPYMLHLKKWNLVAGIKISGKFFSLELDQKVGIESHYKRMSVFIPPEITSFIDSFNERGGPYRASLGVDYVPIGQQSYCFPDVTFASSDGAKVHLELFHRWHMGQLGGRLKALDQCRFRGLIVGVAEDIAKSAEVSQCLASSAWFKDSGFTFKTLPTPKSVASALARHDARE